MELVISFITTYIFNQPFILLSLVAMIGLIIQRKPIQEVLSGSIKTGLGYLILQQGTSLLARVVLPISALMNHIFKIEAVAPGVGTDVFTEEWASAIAVIMVIGFVVNLLLARFAKLKYVYLTVHQTYYISLVYIAILVEVVPTPNKLAVMIIGGIILGIYSAVSPALVQPYMRDVVGSNDIAYGHTTSFGMIVASLVGKLFKKHKDESSEDLKIPEKLSFLKDISVSTAIIMTILYSVSVLIAGPAWVAENVSGGTAGLLWAIQNGMAFGVGITIVLTGVGMMVAEITEAFKGISEKLVPNAVPALDCPIVFNFAPTAVMIGFLSCLATVLICVGLFGALGIYALTPPVITCFFGGGPAGVFGNSQGGWRGALIAGIVSGLLLSFGQMFTVNAMQTTIADFARWSNDFDYSAFPALVKALLSLIFGR